MKNVMFREVPVKKPSSSAFDLSHDRKLSFRPGELVPFCYFHTVPGDKFSISTEHMLKFMPLLAPTFSRWDVFFHWFKVPYRLLMNPDASMADWDTFYAGDPENGYYEQVPQLRIDNTNKAYFTKGSLQDHLGLPVINSLTISSEAEMDINLFPQFAYHLIWDEYYRDENLTDRKTDRGTGISDIQLIGGYHDANAANILTNLRYVAYEKDYFRGALPNAYAGSSDDVELDLDFSGTIAFATRYDGTGAAGGAVSISGTDQLVDSGSQPIRLTDEAGGGSIATLEILELRRAEALTRYLEAENRGGRRAPEMMLSIFGIISDDLRLSVPEYLGGHKEPVKVSSVLSQTEVLDPAGATPTTVNAQGYETGRGVSAGGSKRIECYCKEFGIIMGMMFVRPRTSYTGGIDKFWTKLDRLDFYNPYFQNIGDQEVLNHELGYDGTTAAGNGNDDVFGYVPRWAEYKFKNSEISGDFRDNLAFWHNGYIHDPSGPLTNGLTDTFVWVNPSKDEIDRIFAVQDGSDNMYAEVFINARAIRPMYVHDIPK